MARNPILTKLKRNWEYSIAIFIVIYYVITHVILGTAHVHHDTGLKNHLRVLPKEVIEYWDSTQTLDTSSKKYAYYQYATGYDYLNMAIMNFIILRKSGSKINHMVVLYDQTLSHSHPHHWNNLVQLAVEHKIRLKPVEAIKAPGKDSSTWASSFTKFHVFSQTEYDRIVFFDSDSMFVQNEVGAWSNIDELFKIPENITYALPQAYWLNNVVEQSDRHKNVYHKKVTVPSASAYESHIQRLVKTFKPNEDVFEKLPSLVYEHHKYDNSDDFFANHVMVLTPSKKTFAELKDYVHNPWSWYLFQRSKLKLSSEYDMEILNKYLDHQLAKKNNDFRVGILPHKVYGVLTGEFKERWHRRFVAEPQYLPFISKFSNAGWNASEVRKEAKLIHFSDSPIPKPWEEQDRVSHYNALKIYCAERAKNDPERFKTLFPSQYRPRLVDDCDAVDIWNSFRDVFSDLQHKYWVV